ncbi:MAG: hypothetical protein RMK99_08610 [Anaerolineales bacterium]|nr:hypothetical protein [Anaerolineales bacterium]
MSNAIELAAPACLPLDLTQPVRGLLAAGFALQHSSVKFQMSPAT